MRVTSGNEMDSAAVIALKREKSLLEQVLHLAVCELDMLELGRVEDVERLLFLRAERMGHFATAEANVYTKMPDVQNNPSLNPEEIAELHDLNLQIINLADRIVAIDELANQLDLNELLGDNTPKFQLTLVRHERSS
jgi:hypothetical protein